MDSRAAVARQVARFAAAPALVRSLAGRLAPSTYGCSNRPSSNFTRSTRATAASTTRSESGRAECVQVRPLLSVRRLKDHVEAGIERMLRGSRGAGLGHVQHRRAARAGRIRNDESLEPPVRFRMSVSSQRFWCAGRPSTEL